MDFSCGATRAGRRRRRPAAVPVIDCVSCECDPRGAYVSVSVCRRCERATLIDSAVLSRQWSWTDARRSPGHRDTALDRRRNAKINNHGISHSFSDSRLATRFQASGPRDRRSPPSLTLSSPARVCFHADVCALMSCSRRGGIQPDELHELIAAVEGSCLGILRLGRGRRREARRLDGRQPAQGMLDEMWEGA